MAALSFDDLAQPQAQPDPADQFADRILASEHSRDGQTSPKGAQDAYQVMPRTAANPGFGVTPAKDDSPEEHDRVGRDLAKAFYNHYGNAVLAAAAYNAGPGNTDAWIKKYGDPRTGKISDQDFVNKIPSSEAKAYAANYVPKPASGPLTFDDVAPGSTQAAKGAISFDDIPPAKDVGILGEFGHAATEATQALGAGLNKLGVTDMAEKAAGAIPGIGPAIQAMTQGLRFMGNAPAQAQTAGDQPIDIHQPLDVHSVTEKIAHGAGETVPAVLGATVGGIPLAAETAFAQTYGPKLAEEQAKNPNDPVGNQKRAAESATVDAAATAIGWKLFEFTPFKHEVGQVINDVTGEVSTVYKKTVADTIKNIAAQGLGIQPAVALVGQGIQNMLDGKPITEDMPQAYVQGGIANTLMMGIAHVLHPPGLEQSPWRKPAAGETTPYNPSGLEGQGPIIDQGGPGGYRPGGGAAAAGQLPAPNPPVGSDIGLKFPNGTVQRATVEGYGANGSTVKVRYEDGSTAEHLTSEVRRDMAAPPPARYETEPEPPKPYQRQLGPDEGKAPPFGEAPPEPVSKAAAAKIASRQPQPVMDPQAMHALDLANRLEAAAADPGVPMSTADRMAAMMQVARLRQQFAPEGEESRPAAYRHPSAAEPAQDLGELGAARAAQPENYQGEYQRQPFAPSHVSRDTLDLTPFRPTDLLQFLGSRGGLQSDDPYVAGNLQAMDAHKKFMPGTGMLVRKTGGMPLDKAREAAQEAGYGIGYNNFESTDDLLDAIRDSLGGRDVFSHTENGGIAAAQAWEAHKQAQRIDPHAEQESRDMVDELRSRAEHYGIPVGEDWTADDLMAAVTEREAILADRAHSQVEAKHEIDARELDMDHYLAVNWPEVYGGLRHEAVAEENPVGEEGAQAGQPGTQPEAAAPAGEHGGEGTPGKETGPPGAGGHPGEPGARPPEPAASPAEPVASGALPRQPNINPKASKELGDRRLANANFFGDSAGAHAIKAHGFNSLGIDRQRMVLAQVRSSLDDHQIFQAIIQSVPIDVMNDLIGQKVTPEMLLHDPAVLTHRLSISRDVAIPKAVGRFIDSLSAQVEGASARLRAEESGLAGSRTPSEFESSPASGISTDDNGRVLQEFTAAGQRGTTHINPSNAQIEAGNYQKGSINFQGIHVAIENPAGSERRGIGPNGQPWSVTLQHPYGYVKRSEGADGENVDVYIGPHHDSPDVFVVDQIDPKTGDFDEHKSILGARTEEEARAIYDAGFSDGSGPARAGAITAMPIDEFKQWAQSGPKREPLSYRPPAIEAPLAPVNLDRQGPEDLRTAAATAPVRADPAADEVEEVMDDNIATHLPEAKDDPAWFPAIETAAEPPAAGRPHAPGEPVRPAASQAESRPQPAAEPARSGHPEGEGTATRQGAGVRVTENEDRNGVEVRFSARPTDDVLGKLKAAGFRWSKPQKLWYAKRSPRTLEVANSLKGEPGPFTTTPGAIAAEHAAEVSSLEAQGTAAAAAKLPGRTEQLRERFKEILGQHGHITEGGVSYRLKGIEIGHQKGFVIEKRGLRGVTITLGGVAHQGLWSRDKALDEAAHEAYPAGLEPTQQAADTGAAEAARAEMDASTYQPAAMPITSADPPPKKPPAADLFSVGDAVQPRPENTALPPRPGPRYVTDVSLDGKQVTLDGGAILPARDLEPTLEHGVPEPLPERPEGQGPEAISGTGQQRPNQPAPSGEDRTGIRPARPAAGERAAGTGRTPTRSPSAAIGGGEGHGADAGLHPAEPGTGAVRRPDALVRGENFQIEPGALEEGRGPKAKAADNLAAINLVKRLIAEDRPATREEQAILAKYVGWGGLSGAFQASDGRFGTGFEDIGRQLKEALTPDEYATASKSTQYAHYTAENVIRSMWQAVADMGFDGGSVFEPGMAVGHFLGLMPPDIAAKSHYQGIELDHLTAQIASKLYPQSGVRQANFIETPMPENAFDLVIGNPPFSDTIIKADPKYAAKNFMLHDYFFAKSLDSVRPGGLLAFVTSAGTMNKLHPDARNYLGQRAVFVGGVRLPSNAFKKNAGTEVTTDVLFFQKRPEALTQNDFQAEPEAGWTGTVQRELLNAEGIKTKGNVSRYFSEHPEQVLGREGFFDKLYKDRYAVHADDGQDLGEGLSRALGNLPKDIYRPAATPEQKAAMDFSSNEHKDGSFYVGKDGRLMQYGQGAGRPVQARGAGVEGGVTAKDMERIKGLIPIRDALRDVFTHDLAENHADAAVAREQLNRAYDAFTRKFGPINLADYQYRRPNIIQQESARAEAREMARDRGEVWREGTFNAAQYGGDEVKMAEIARARQAARDRHGSSFDEGSFNPAELPDIVIEKRPNIDPFMDDQESYRLRAIEDYDEKTRLATKRRIFNESIITREQEPVLNSANDGVLWSLNKLGRFDVDAIARKMGREPHDIITELGDMVYKVPGTDDTYQTSDEYLSGDILTKLDEARAAAQHDPAIRRNIPALEAAIPAPLAPSEISMTLGMPWIPAQHVEEFATSRLNIGQARIRHSPTLGGWTVRSITNGPDAPLWGVDEVSAHKMLQAALNRRAPRIYKEVFTPEGKRREFDPVATQAVQDKYEAMRTAFQDWLTSDPKRLDELSSIYNNTLNRSVLRVHDGSYLTTPGVAADWSWRPHQKRGVARVIQTGNTYLAHAVGAGKTSLGIGAIMEMRRLGLVNKPMIPVPNHMLGQWAKEFYEQYPTAKIMVADERRFHTSRRKQFIANVAQADLDAVIITHSAFGKIPISGNFQKQLISEELDALEEALKSLDKQDDRITIKRLENQKEKLEQKIKAATGNRKDMTNTFEEMGVDFLLVDEAHLFRKLAFATKQSGLKGVDPDGSEAAFDLYSKIRYLESKTPGRSAVLMSGTPVTNTMAELFSISRYLQSGELQDRGIDHFDSWASTFGDTKQELEQTADGGYQSMTRFSRFVNIPELFKMVGQVMDIVTPAQLDQYVVRPKLKGGKRNLVLAPRTDFLDDYQAELARRMQAIKNRRGAPKKGDDIMLSVINDGRKAAIDPRFIMGAGENADAMAKDSKLSIMIYNVHKIWQRSKDTQFYDPKTNYQSPIERGPATQMIFANIGVNPNETSNGFSVYGQIKKELLARGIPPSEIAFIKDYKSHVARQKLFNDMNEGIVRILVGSTQKMGTGVNAQRRLYAIHNMDPLWYPADDEQRVGRGLRQGNWNPEIEIHDYSTKGTYDASMWQMMGRKARFIEQFFRGDPELRDMEDLGEASQYEQASAISTADPRIMELTELRQNLDKAVRREAAHDREQYSMRQQLTSAHESVARVDRSIPVVQADIAKRKLPADGRFEFQVGGKHFTDINEAGKYGREEILDKAWPTLEEGKDLKIGTYGGFDFYVHKPEKKFLQRPFYFFERSDGKEADLEANTPIGAMRAMVHRLDGFENEIKWLEGTRTDAQAKIKSLEGQIGKPFTGGDEIMRLREAVKDMEKALTPPKEDKDQTGIKAQVPETEDGFPIAEEPIEPSHEIASAEEIGIEPENSDIAAQEPVAEKPVSIWANIAGTRRLAPDFYARLPRIPSEDEAQLIEQVNRILNQVAPTADVIPAKDLIYRGRKIWGATYFDGPRSVIAWSLESPSAAGTAHHEAIHWLRNLGFFRPGEWEALSKAALDDDWLKAHDIDERYPGMDRADKIEEAVAEEYSSWARRQTTPPAGARSLFGRIRDFLGRVAKYLRSLFGKDVTAEDIFGKILSGEIGSRQPMDKWKPSAEVFAQAAKTPEGPPETPAEGKDYIDATTNDLAEQLRGKGPGTYERTLQNMAPKTGPEMFARANWLQREFVGPRTVAEIDTKSGRFWAAIQREDDESSQRLSDLRGDIRDNFLKLPRANQDRVNAVMELDRLNSVTRADDGRSIVARNTEHEDARGSQPGQTIILSPEETKAYYGLQRMYRQAWDNIMEGTARRMGWQRAWSPSMQDNFRALQRAVDTADGNRNRKAFQRIHDILSAMEEQRRQAYMPLMRYGDYYFSVTPKYDKESTGGFPDSVWFSLAERPSFQYADVDPAKMLRFETTQTGQIPDYAKQELAQLQAKYPAQDFRINHGYLLSKPDMLRQMSIPAIEKLMMLLESGVLDRMKTEASMEGMANKGAAYKKAKEDWGNLYEELVDAVRDEMYEQIKAGFKKRSRTVPGYSPDFNRSLGSYMGWTSRHVARQIHGDTVERLYDDIQTSHPHSSIREYWADWKKDDDSPLSPVSRIGMAANQIGFLWTMAMNPASTFSIAMHGPTYAIPTLGTGIGVPKAAAAFTKAYGEATAAVRWDAKHGAIVDISKVGRTPDERAFLKGMEEAGYLHAKGADDIRSMAEKSSAIWGDYTPHASQAMDMVSSNIAVADQANRVAASLAAYRLARDGNLGHMNATWAGNQVWRAISEHEGVSPESMGKFLLNQSVGEWGGRSRSKFGRTPVGRMGSSLHGFQIRFLSNWLKQLFRQGGAGRIAAAWSMAALWGAAGLQGLPFVQDAENGIDWLWQKLRGHDPMLAWRIRAILVDSGLGKLGADIVMRGPLSTATGIDFASRLGFGDVITRDVAPWFGAANEAALTFPSIVFGAIRSFSARAGSHQQAAAWASLLPGALRHPAQAVIDAEHGVKSQTGKTMYVPARKFTGADEAKEAAGFTPLDVERARERADYRYLAGHAHGRRPPQDLPP